MAADMAVKAPPKAVVPAPTYSWTGFYVGGNAGYGWKDPTVNFTPNDVVANAVTCSGAFPASTCPPSASFHVDGALGGLQAGYNWQVNQSWLVGFETDFDWSGIKGTGTSNFLMAAAGNPSNFQASENINWFGTARARLGYLPTNNLLLYGTGGFAYGQIKENVGLNSMAVGANNGTYAFGCVIAGGPGVTNCFVGNSSRTATGFTIGGGVEYALWQNLSVKAEYLYVNLGHGNTVNVVAQDRLAAAAPSSFTAAYSRVDFNVIRGGLNWKFN